ncbi:MAG: hypothetical protein IKE24_04745 [Clostridia bacterium]|nr:hypothetical protein [Clostridia bacterium]
MVQAELVRETLRRCFGGTLEKDEALLQGVCGLLNGYRPGKDTFSDMAGRMEDYLFNALYDRAGPGMSFLGDDGIRRRVRLADLPLWADQMLFPLFASLKPWSVDYERLRTWFMETGSWSAMFALLTVYSDFLPGQERRVLSRAVRENISPALWPENLEQYLDKD